MNHYTSDKDRRALVILLREMANTVERGGEVHCDAMVEEPDSRPSVYHVYLRSHGPVE